VDQRTGSEQLFYTMLAPDKSTLIDGTQLTTGTAAIRRPDLAVGNATHIHVVWQDDRLTADEVFHLVLNPGADDQDGSSADPAAIVTTGAALISTDDGEASTDPQVAADGLGRLHVVWGDPGVGTIHYAQRADDGAVLLGDRTVFSAGGSLAWGRALPVVTADANNDVHLVWMHRPAATVEIWYAMLSGSSGDVRIAPTQLTTASGVYDERYPSVGVGPGDEITVIYEGKTYVYPYGVRSFLYMLRIDPGLDDQNGDAAMIGSITTFAPQNLFFFSSWSDQMLPTAVVDIGGTSHCSYYSSYSGDHGTLVFVRFDASGVQVGNTRNLSGIMTGTTTIDFTRPSVAIHDAQSYIGWTDDQYGSAEIVLNVVP
jgi:hypothetical protein